MSVFNNVKEKIIGKVVRSRFSYPDSFGDVRLVIARTSEEIDKANDLVYKCYQDVGFNPTDRFLHRAGFYSALDTSIIFLVKKNEMIIGTFSIIVDSVYGIISDSDFDIEHLRRRNNLVAEISSLSIAKEFQGASSKYFVFIIKSVLDFCLKILKVNYIVAAVTPRRALLYKALLGFENISNNTIYDKSINSKEIQCLYVDILKAETNLASLYKGKARLKNFYELLYNTDFSQYYEFNLSTLFIHRSAVSLDALKRIYERESFLNPNKFLILNNLQRKIDTINLENCKRYFTNLNAIISNRKYSVMDISRSGVKVKFSYMHPDYYEGQDVDGHFLVLGFKYHFSGYVVWIKGSFMGVKFNSIDNEFINVLGDAIMEVGYE